MGPLTQHIPVLLDEVLEALDPRPGLIIVDGTLGGGGHARSLAERVVPGGFVIGLDRDANAIERATNTLAGLPIKVATARYAELPQVLAEVDVKQVDGCLLDLGLSSDQLADDTRGFSFDSPGPLDLRFDASQGEPAWRLLERLPAEQIADLIYKYGEERYSRRIARAIVERRRAEPVRTSLDLAELVKHAVPRPRTPATDRIHPATRTFQALRIAVNDELGELERFLRRIPELLALGGRIAIISFHSLEDRLVKEAFRQNPELVVLTKKPIRPSEAEIARNPRARSAKMRVARRINA